MCHMSASRFRFYTTSAKAWSAMLTAISLAQKSIFLEMYIFEEDTEGYDFISELERKAKSGVKVVLILDALGSYDLKSASVDRLRIAGVEVLFYSHFWKHTHRKILIIDEFTVFVGGVNIGKNFAPWRDLQMRLSGKNFANTALFSFRRVYMSLSGKDPVLLSRELPHPLERAKHWFIEHGTQTKKHTLRQYYETHIGRAEKSIILVTPYFIPRRWMIALLHSALLRGVEVQIIVPERTDHAIVDRINYRFLSMFGRLGANCLVTPHMNHAKAMLIDDNEAIVGSHNLDALSFEHNIESGVFFNNIHMVKQLGAIIAKWKKGALPLTNIQKWKWYDVVISLFFPFFESVL